MNYYYDLPTDIISLIDDKVNNMYFEEHKDKMVNIRDTLRIASVFHAQKMLINLVMGKRPVDTKMKIFEKNVESIKMLKSYMIGIDCLINSDTYLVFQDIYDANDYKYKKCCRMMGHN